MSGILQVDLGYPRRAKALGVTTALAAFVHAAALIGVPWAPASVMEAVTSDESVTIELAAAPPAPPPPVAAPAPPPPPPPPPEPEPDPEPEPTPEPKPKPKPQPKPQPQQPRPKQTPQRTDPKSTAVPQQPAKPGPVGPQSTQPVQNAKPVMTPPAPSTSHSNPKPAYPELARKRGQEGLVRVRVEIDEGGNLLSVGVAESSGYKLLDDAAVKTVKRWRFKPATRDGVPVRGIVTVPIEFRLNQ